MRKDLGFRVCCGDDVIITTVHDMYPSRRVMSEIFSHRDVWKEAVEKAVDTGECLASTASLIR